MWYKLAQQNEKLNIPLPDYVKGILTDIGRAGGRAMIVGGAVRDAILGAQPKDIDFEVYKVNYDTLSQILSKYGKADLVGASFGVIKFVGPDGQDFDFSLPRTDSKSGVGHKDIDVSVSSDLTPVEAAARRDFTFNAISYDPLTGEIVDPYNGREDLKNKIMRHTSDAFAEDALRPLRGMQFSSRYGFDIAPETAELARSIKDQYQHLPKERVEGEFKKLVQKGVEPGKALKYLYDTGWSENFSEIHNLLGVPQDHLYHPEGWGFSIVPLDSFTTGVTVAKPINDRAAWGQLFNGPIANSASSESANITASAKLQIKPGVHFSDFKSTKRTGIFNHSFFPRVTAPTSLTPAKSFVRLVSSAANQTGEIIGVMFQIPLSSVDAIMESSVDNFQIFDGIVQSVAVAVVDMLRTEQSSSSENLHDISVKKDTSGLSSGNADFSISTNVIEPKFAVIDNNVVFYFYLGYVGHCNIHNFNPKLNAIFVNLGDVSLHTSLVMNEAAKIAKRENLTPEQKEVLVYSALAHDFAKTKTTKSIMKNGRPTITSHGHEEQGQSMAKNFLENIGVNKKIIDQVVPLVGNHLNHIHHSNSTNQEAFVKKLAERLHPATVKQLIHLIEADHSGRHPLPPGLPAQAHNLAEQAKQHNAYEGKVPDLLQGRDVMEYTGQGGPIIGQILKEHRNLLLNHNPEMRDRQSALKWLHNRMQRENGLINGNDVINTLNVKGPEIKDILNRAWQAQRQGLFHDKAGALSWLATQS